MGRIFVNAKTRNEIASTLARDLEERPHDFDLDCYYLYDRGRGLRYWISNGMSFLAATVKTGDEVFLGSGLRWFPFWWPLSGFRGWYAFKKWKRRYHREEENSTVVEIMKRVRTDA